MLLCVYLVNLIQTVSGTVEFNDDLVVNGISLSVIFNVIIVLLQALGIFNPENKKRIGGYLLIAGALAGGGYGFMTNVTDNMQILQYVVSGALAGLLSVGTHSTIKNVKESLRMKK